MAVNVRPGFKIVKSIERADPQLVEKFRDLVAANISDIQGRQQTMDARIKPVYHPMPKLCGPAITVKARTGDNLVSFKAIELAQPGDVIVIDGGFDMNYSLWGGVMSAMAKKKGIAGVVTDGLVRDVAQTRDVQLPMFSSGLTPVGPTKEGVGQLNVPISCGGVIVNPGDIVVGDEDGVVVVRKEEAAEVLKRTEARVALEVSWFERIERGELFLMDSDDELRRRGALVID
jgi:regulator of RNase E activity RraA